MSTRGVIARKTAEGWVGVYHHFDSYPTALGAEIWKLIHQEFKNNIHEFLKFAIDSHPAGWSHIMEAPIIDNEKPFIAKRKGRQCYCHGYYAKRDRITPSADRLIIYPDCIKDPQQKLHNCLFLEWVYILDQDHARMEIWRNYNTGEPILVRGVNTYNQPYEYESTQYDWLPITNIDLNEAEPDWHRIMQIADTFSDLIKKIRDKNIIKRRRL